MEVRLSPLLCVRSRNSKWGKSPGTQVQHALAIGTRGTEFRHFLSSNCGTIWACVESARGFAPIACEYYNPLI
jgi:hypothetical protein